MLRAKAGDRVLLFNGRDGEWLARDRRPAKRGVTRRPVCKQTQPQAGVPDIWLVFAPVKKTPADYLVQKATELGVSDLQPVFTRRTIVTRVNQERHDGQCDRSGGTIGAADGAGDRRGGAVWKNCWRPGRTSGGFISVTRAVMPSRWRKLRARRGGPAAILTGPEGGFDPAERAALRALPFVTPVTLGPRILRADTAALAALAIWQSVAGTGQLKPLSSVHSPRSVRQLCAARIAR